MTEAKLFPDHAWFDGKVASWEGRRFGYVSLFEVIGDPKNFKETVNSAGDDEIVELHEPQPGQVLTITYLDKDADDAPMGEPVVLTAEDPTTIIPQGSRFIMDATDTTAEGALAYTCIAFGLQELE